MQEYQYQVRFYENRRLRYKPAGKKATAADALRDRIEKQHSVKAAAEAVGVRVETVEERETLSGSAAAYIRDAEKRGANEATEQARLVSAEFMRVVRKTYVDEITRDDVFRFHEALRKRGCEERTVANKHQRLISWLRFSGSIPVPCLQSRDTRSNCQRFTPGTRSPRYWPTPARACHW